MSILVKPYEISVWEDQWDSTADGGKGKFVEKRICIIGSDQMVYQGRAIEPMLVRNVNGTKKFSFKMHKYFVDNITGEKTENPFVKYLISERKVKLKYGKDDDTRWYDFIVKDIAENSSNYLYTYSLEDTLVQELSKNGFGVILDEQLRNNMGDVEYLATEALKETDWIVQSEKFVERVDEALVYIQLPATYSNKTIHKLTDNDENFLQNGLIDGEDNSIWGKEVLAFYSSCRNKPHRFQFICLTDYSKANVSIDKNRQILNKNCQYYIEFEPSEYTVVNTTYDFVLPTGFSVVDKAYSDSAVPSDSTISTWYRGGRYGFAQKTIYVSLLDRYCQVYQGPEYDDPTSENNKSNEYYGYVENLYNKPVFNTNLVTNTEFSNTSGWIATYNANGNSSDKAVVENVYGKFIDNNFVSTTDVLAGTANIGQTFEEFLNDNSNKCTPYMKIELKTNNSLIINSGPYDNRTLIEKMPVGSKWAFRAEYLSSTGGSANLTFSIDEYTYNTTTGHYSAPSNKKITFTTTTNTDKDGNGYTIYTVDTNNFANEIDFTKNCKLKIAISGNAGTYYIKNLEFFLVQFDKDNKVIALDKQGDAVTDGIITKNYRYFKPSELDIATEAKNIHYDYEANTLSYNIYKPVYNVHGEKIRAVSAKESNYFNILQSIAETFECWLDLEIKRDNPDQPGAITEKIAKFKNYTGGDNYACFRYGVNLKDIKRTYSSKNIVTKLMVKQNSNEHGENGFCTIARASANPTGDTSIYDFSYFQNMGLMNAHDYIDIMYKIDGAEGPDVNNGTDYNLQGYFPRIRAINNQLLSKVDVEVSTKQELLTLNAELEVQKAKQFAAASGMEESSENYLQMTGVYPTELVDGKVSISSIELDTTNKYSCSIDEKKGHLSYYENEADPDYVLRVEINSNKISIKALPPSGKSVFESTKTLSITAYPILTTQNNTKIVQTLYFTLEIEKDKTSATSEEQTPVIDTSAPQIQKYFNEYATYAQEKHEADIKVPELESEIAEKQAAYDSIATTIDTLREHKAALNKLFFTLYSRFIQEGTWIDEEYYDDEKYYNDALSVMYNSCYPQVAYTINTFEISQLPGYEMFNFDVGEKTWAEDGEFFGFDNNGYPKREEVIITEKSENLDDPSKNTNKVQNFKNQFQDLFQKITATVQQTQYNTGAYEKGVAEANAIAEDSTGFLRDAISRMAVNLDNPQVFSESTDKSSQLKIVDGKILIGEKDPNTEEVSWRTGLSSSGIAADLINTGRLNTSEIQIFGGDNPTFRWDTHGISAYDYTNYNQVISGVNTKKFVRFDKFGLYGVNNADSIDGASWYPSNIQQIDSKATFALTWEGLKVTGNNNVVARIGKLGGNIIKVSNGTDDTFVVDNNGNVTVRGNLMIGDKSAKEYIDDSTEQLQHQIDGAISSWFKDAEPLPNADKPEAVANKPASDWSEEEEKQKHEGDLYYNKSNGYCYRWIYDDIHSKHLWIRITDTDITKALGDAAEALETANSKMDPTKNGNYSWDFNTDRGLMMWSGEPAITDTSATNYGDWDKESNMVFKVGKNENGTAYLKLRGSGEFTGKITAEEGDIAGWKIHKKSSNDTADINKMYYPATRTTPGMGIRPDAVGTYYTIWAGFSSPTDASDPYDYLYNYYNKGGIDTPVDQLTPFFVKGDGSLVATKGYFGNLLIEPRTIYAASSPTGKTLEYSMCVIDKTYHANSNYDLSQNTYFGKSGIFSQDPSVNSLATGIYIHKGEMFSFSQDGTTKYLAGARDGSLYSTANGVGTVEIQGNGITLYSSNGGGSDMQSAGSIFAKNWVLYFGQRGDTIGINGLVIKYGKVTLTDAQKYQFEYTVDTKVTGTIQHFMVTPIVNTNVSNGQFAYRFNAIVVTSISGSKATCQGGITDSNNSQWYKGFYWFALIQKS